MRFGFYRVFAVNMSPRVSSTSAIDARPLPHSRRALEGFEAEIDRGETCLDLSAILAVRC
jgi:hypothetical protein